MIENVGTVILLKQKRKLEYYVFGDETEGFGVRIVQKGVELLQAERRGMTKDREQALAFAHRLASGTVFPQHLSNILEDGGFCCLNHSVD